MSETLSWLHEWNLIVSTNWMVFHDTHFSSWNISTLFFRNKNFKVVKEKFHHISPPLEIWQNSETLGPVNFVKFLKVDLYDEFFFHRWLNFSFDSLLSTFNTCIQLRNMNEIFQSTIMKLFQKNFYQIFDKIFFFWNTIHESKIKSLLKMT